MRVKVFKPLAVSVCVMASCSAYAARPVDLSRQPVSLLKNYVVSPSRIRSMAASANNADQVKETTRALDSKNNTHIRMQQYHQGFPVWGADSVVHVPASRSRMLLTLAAVPESAKSTMNGTMYQGLDADLQGTPAFVFNSAQADKAVNEARRLAKARFGAEEAEVNQSQLMVYVDDKNKAHWAFLVSLYLDKTGEHQVPAKPVYIMDAVSFNLYKSWNDMKTEDMQHVNGGGFGGNPKMGKIVYDGLAKDLVALDIERDGNTCYLQNNDVQIYDYRKGGMWQHGKLVKFDCAAQDGQHNNVFWDGSMDPANGGYSPDNDALYAGTIVQHMYQQWYGIPMLANKNGKPMLLKMYTHYGHDWENAEWDDQKKEIHLGDGADWAYPLTSLGVIAHEVSHGFTSQHADLIYADQSGSMNESFSDMAAQAAEAFATGNNKWQIGPEVVKKEGGVLRYMDQPSKGCLPGKSAGQQCSIDSASQYQALVSYAENDLELYGDMKQSYIVHLASGVYNRAFYLLATSDGYDVKKAFEVMLHANSFYWTKHTNFQSGACGVMHSIKDLGYDPVPAKAAFEKVGIDVNGCA